MTEDTLGRWTGIDGKWCTGPYPPPPEETDIMKVTKKQDGTWEASYKCPFCPCEWASMHDLQRHLDAFGNNQREHTEKLVMLKKHGATEDNEQWYPSKYGNGEELKLTEKDPELAAQIRRVGTVVTLRYSYRLNGKWIIRKRIGA